MLDGRQHDIPTGTSGRHVLPAERFARRQMLHFSLCVMTPTILAFALPVLVEGLRPTLMSVGILLFMWFLVGGLGVSVGLHRLFSHRSFKAPTGVKVLLGIFGSMAAQGPVSYWVALHRLHHAHSDERGDPHSPHAGPYEGSRWKSFLHGHIGWTMLHDVPKPSKYTKDLDGDAWLKWVARNYWVWVMAGIALPAVLGWMTTGNLWGAANGAVWGGLVRIAAGHHVIWAVNSLCHTVGSAPHHTGDHSTNVAWVALLSWGEGWHNNHHSNPSSARFGSNWRQIDMGWWSIRMLEAVGLVSEVRTSRRTAMSTGTEH